MSARIRASRALAVAAVAMAASSAHAQIVGIFSNYAGQANNTVPTLGGNFQTGTTSTIAFDRPFVSPDGSRWLLNALSENGTDDRDLIIIGGGTTSAGSSTVASEDTATTFDPTRMYETFNVKASINNAGQYSFVSNLTGTTTDDESIIRFDGVSQSVFLREGQASPIAGQNYGATIDSANILANGSVAHRASLSPTTAKQIAVINGAVVAETDVTTPANQLVMPTQTIDLTSTDRFNTSFDGAHYVMHGDLNGPTTTDAFVLYDGGVVVQEGAPLPGNVVPGLNVGVISTETGSAIISHNGSHWSARTAMSDGTGATATDVVLRNGAVVSKTGDSVPGTSELFDDTIFTTTYFSSALDGNGNMVVGGLTNNASVDLDAVLVYYGASGSSFVLAREGDPVDLNGDGMFNDNTFIDVFANDDNFLTDSGRYYFVAALQDSAGLATGTAFMSMPIPEPSGLALVGVAAIAGLRRRRA